MAEQNTPQQKQSKILLLGDICIDEYQYGTVDRISPEAPVPVFKVDSIESKPGMVGNVEKNLKNLGCIVTTFFGTPSQKTRYIDKRSKQQMIRIDNDMVSTPFDPTTFSNLKDYDAIVISDYNKGFISYETIETLRRKFTGPMFLDTKKNDLAAFRGINVKINELEYNNRISINDKLIVTLGAKGAMYKTNRDPKYESYYDCPKVEVVDVTGAGDTFLAALAYQFLQTYDINKAIEFAIKASSISVQHMGCYAPTLGEICD